MNKDNYEKLKEAFKKYPGDVARAAKEVGVAWRTARRAWEEGDARTGAPPLSGVISIPEESAILTTRAPEAPLPPPTSQEIERKVLESAVSQERILEAVSEAAERWLAILDSGRASAQDAAAAVRELLAYLRDLVARAREWDPRDMPPIVALKMAAEVAEAGERLMKVIERQQRIESLALGKPTAIVGVQHEQREMTEEEVQRRLEVAARALERGRRKVIDISEADDGRAKGTN